MLTVRNYIETTHMIFLTADWAIPITWLQRRWPFINRGWWFSKPELKKMTTQIQKEYIKTVNCQKTSSDVLGRDSWTWTDCRRQGLVLVTLSMNPQTQRKYIWHHYRASWNVEPTWKVRMNHMILLEGRPAGDNTFRWIFHNETMRSSRFNNNVASNNACFNDGKGFTDLFQDMYCPCYKRSRPWIPI